jgi:hypothetical protein
MPTRYNNPLSGPLTRRHDEVSTVGCLRRLGGNGEHGCELLVDLMVMNIFQPYSSAVEIVVNYARFDGTLGEVVPPPQRVPVFSGIRCRFLRTMQPLPDCESRAFPSDRISQM